MSARKGEDHIFVVQVQLEQMFRRELGHEKSRRVDTVAVMIESGHSGRTSWRIVHFHLGSSTIMHVIR